MSAQSQYKITFTGVGGGLTSKKPKKKPNPKMEITGNVGFFGFYRKKYGKCFSRHSLILVTKISQDQF